ncbi:hypothetical protein DPEC_G00007920 [Dallia pectoralis]|uniref:Uncharacterized protein n=1 Tax=Dallia pectoralis TaxID=75939 RepID=A0ACC2HKJ0_DALPE|nr:hypothetical protein DPEC_G00007920 [Dallia pectoralis]
MQFGCVTCAREVWEESGLIRPAREGSVVSEHRQPVSVAFWWDSSGLSHCPGSCVIYVVDCEVNLSASVPLRLPAIILHLPPRLPPMEGWLPQSQPSWLLHSIQTVAVMNEGGGRLEGFGGSR